MRINDAIWDELEAENRTLKAENTELNGQLHSSVDWLRAQTAEAALSERDNWRCETCRNAKWYEASPGEGFCQFVSHISFGFYCKYWTALSEERSTT